MSPEVRELIRRLSRSNPLWGAPRIHGELLKLGIDVGQATVSKYMVRPERPPSQSWRTFLVNHAREIASIDFFTVPTATFRVLYVFLVLDNARRQILHFNVTESPTAVWTGQQVAEAFPWDSAPRYLIRDRDGIYGLEFKRRIDSFGIKQVRITPRSPWQNPFVERVIGSIRRECLDHVIIFNEQHLRRVLREYIGYYNRSGTHLGLTKDCPVPRLAEPQGSGPVRSEPVLGGLHHWYFRRAARQPISMALIRPDEGSSCPNPSRQFRNRPYRCNHAKSDWATKELAEKIVEIITPEMRRMGIQKGQVLSSG